MAEQLKELFSKDFVEFISIKIKEYYSTFDEKNFQKKIFNKNWKNLELKERMRFIVLNLNDFIPIPYIEQLEVLKKVKKDLEYKDSMALQSMVFQDFVEVFGLDDYENSIKALEVFTIKSSSEFAIRQFILKYQDKTMTQMKTWTKDKNEHIRRLASEGCRPRLPWAIALPKYKKDPTVVLEILELLKNDKSEYVRKSVANNLNDIAKDNPHLVIEFVAKNLGKTKNLDWICKHASRTLLKRGDKDILKLFDYGSVEHIRVNDFKLDTKVHIGDSFKFCFALKSEIPLGNLRVEYAIYYLKSNGTYSKKVFMISQNEIKEKKKSFIKKQSFKNMTTRKHYKGEHFISLVLNGIEQKKYPFILEA
ncbi:DNA alkylation repair protein [Arcobacter sp. LA11]|uniref:DNA alkylation repair protein n=1 Tax=Arcobacter sp. LA11 TaxID=1898176 RepID=UPI0009352950|nr:DNA alkylation repair protein [Arcobacter sp. LA11]